MPAKQTTPPVNTAVVKMDPCIRSSENVIAYSFHPTEPRIVIAHAENQGKEISLSAYDTITGKSVGYSTRGIHSFAHKYPYLGIYQIADSNRVITCGSDGKIHQYDLHPNTPSPNFKEPTRAPKRLGMCKASALSKDGKLLAIYNESNHHIQLWHLPEVKFSSSIPVSQEDPGNWHATALAFSQDEKSIVAVGGNTNRNINFVKAWNTDTLNSLGEQFHQSADTYTSVITAGNKILAGTSQGKIISVSTNGWLPLTGSTLGSALPFRADLFGRVNSLQLSPDSKSILCATENKLYELETSTGSTIRAPQFINPGSLGAVFSNHGTQLISIHKNGLIYQRDPIHLTPKREAIQSPIELF